MSRNGKENREDMKLLRPLGEAWLNEGIWHPADGNAGELYVFAERLLALSEDQLISLENFLDLLESQDSPSRAQGSQEVD